MKTRLVLALALGACIATGAHAFTSNSTTSMSSAFPIPTCDPDVPVCNPPAALPSKN